MRSAKQFKAKNTANYTTVNVKCIDWNNPCNMYSVNLIVDKHNASSFNTKIVLMRYPHGNVSLYKGTNGKCIQIRDGESRSLPKMLFGTYLRRVNAFDKTNFTRAAFDKNVWNRATKKQIKNHAKKIKK